MSILKGILHHWNKTSSAYDTIHPETEVAQVTDWNKGIVNTLASTGLSSLVSTLTSDSLLALLIKKVFDATGVKYSLGQNGYLCLGSLFGGLIIQWGTYNVICNYLQEPPEGRYEGRTVHAFPLSFPNACYAALANVADDIIGPSDEATSVRQTTKDNFTLWGEVSSANANITASCVFVGR